MGNPQNSAQWQMSDHDLLIRLNTLTEVIVRDVSEIKSEHAQAVSQLSTRVEALEQAKWMMMGAAAACGAIAGFAVRLLRP